MHSIDPISEVIVKNQFDLKLGSDGCLTDIRQLHQLFGMKTLNGQLNDKGRKIKIVATAVKCQWWWC